MDMMETFRQTYLEESFEGLDVMEAGLLALPPGEPDKEKINEKITVFPLQDPPLRQEPDKLRLCWYFF